MEGRESEEMSRAARRLRSQGSMPKLSSMICRRLSVSSAAYLSVPTVLDKPTRAAEAARICAFEGTTPHRSRRP